MLKYVFAFSLHFVLLFQASGQVLLMDEELLPLDKLDVYSLPPLDNAILKSYYSDVINKPLRFAEPRDINVDCKKNGHWETLKSGKGIWRSIIHSPNAYSLNVAFTRFRLAGDAELYIYNPEQTEVLGPFTEKDNDEHLQLWTPLISGDRIVIELRVSSEYLKTIQLEASRINHDFKDIQKNFQSGSCNLDVACGAADGWAIVDNYRDIISSVGAYTLNGIDQCTGVLINNTSQDCRPYFLTANHCNVTGISSPSVVVYWNYENSVCRQPGSLQSGRAGDGQRTTFNSGAQHRASFFDSDFTLIELDDPIDPQLNLFFSGWDLDHTLPDTAICIHHPNVEEKRISFEFDRLAYDPDGQDTSYIQVNDWDIGTTEPGSSGSPLFNTRKRIIGQLLGGLAACNNDLYDSYGWIRYSWEGGGNSTNRLRDWLDPLGTGLTALDGRSCSYNLELSTNYMEVCGQDTPELEIELQASDFFSDTVSYAILSSSPGLDIELAFSNGLKDNANILRISGLDLVDEDRYTIEIAVEDGENQAQARIDLDVYNSGPSLPELSEPLDGAESLGTTLDLEIRRSSKVINEFQVSDSPGFDNIIFGKLTESRLVELSNLDTDTEYFWRVRATNPCGTSDWSAVFSFTTAASFCTILQSLDGPKAIAANDAPPVRSSISFPYPVIVQDVNIPNVNGTHSYISDLGFSLEFNNNSAVLADAICDDEQDFNFGFDDESAISVFSCPPTDSLLYRPEERLDRFDKTLAGGEWVLQVEDEVNLDGGSFDAWQLEVCFSESLDAAVIPENHTVSYCRNEDIRLVVFYELGLFDGEFELRAYDRNNNALATEFYPRLSSLNTGELSITTEGLAEATNALRLELVTVPDELVLALAVVQLIPAGNATVAEISSPANGSQLKPENFTAVNWVDAGADSYDLQISRDSLFWDIVLEAEGLAGTSLDLEAFNFEQGSYFIRLASVHPCGILYSRTVQVLLDEGTSTENIDPSEIQIIPNPTADYFFIESPYAFGDNAHIELYDIQGMKVSANYQLLSGGKYYFDISGLSSGIYILRIRSGEFSFEKRVVRI